MPKQVKPRKVRVTFTAIIEPFKGRRVPQKEIKELLLAAMGVVRGSPVTNIRGVQVEELEER